MVNNSALLYHVLFFKSIIYSLLGIYTSSLLFPREAGLISVFLTSFALLRITELLFERNKRDIWEGLSKPFEANKRLAISLLFIFLGIMSGYAIFTLFTQPGSIQELLSVQLGTYKTLNISIKEINFGQFKDILGNNIKVLFCILFFSLIYRTGGMLLAITWNASSWGTIFPYIVKISIGNIHINLFSYSLISFVSIFPHLVIESTGYILCSMTGIFLSKGMIKYKSDSNKFIRVAGASLLIFSISLLFIILSAFLETKLAPKLIAYFLSV